RGGDRITLFRNNAGDAAHEFSLGCSRVRQNAGKLQPAFWRTRLRDGYIHRNALIPDGADGEAAFLRVEAADGQAGLAAPATHLVLGLAVRVTGMIPVEIDVQV